MYNTLVSFLSRFRRDEDGATLVEYGIALSLAVAVGAGAMSQLGGDVKSNIDAAHDAMTTTASTSP